MSVIEIVTLAVLFVGLGFMGVELRSMHKTREAELLATLSALWESEPLKQGREAVQTNRQTLTQVLETSATKNPPEFIKLICVSNYFETIGTLVEIGCLDSDTADKLFGTAIWEYYKLYDEYIKKHRGQDPEVYIYFEKLMRKHLK